MNRLGAKRQICTMAIGVLLCLAAALVMLAGCTQPQSEEPPPEPPISAMQPTEPGAPEPAEEPMAPEEPTAPTNTAADRPQEDANMTTLTIETEKGDMVAELFDEQMPITAGSFILLAESGFYDGLTFHRVEPGFVIQGGDPEGTGGGGPGFSIPLEINEETSHDRGILSMARSTDPDSAGSQFFVCLGGPNRVGHLDPGPGNPGYAAFGRVVEGVEVADAISVGDKIVKVTIDSESPDAEAAREAAREARIED